MPSPSKQVAEMDEGLGSETDALVVADVVSVVTTGADEQILKAARGRLLTQQLLRNLRKKQGLSLRDVAERRGVGRSAIQNLENQDIASIQIGTLVKQLHALGHTDLTETVLVKLVLDFIETPAARRVSSGE